MTKRGGNNYKQARAQRRDINDARRIRAERDKARSSTSGAARRWPFELLQNAHDPGPRDGSLLIDVCFTATDTTLRFQHNGRPFTWNDLAALTSGGSTKEYEAVETSGRYGTGFLVTHVLSPTINVSGIVGDEESNEHFYLNLDRSGDETAILQNMEKAEADIESAQAITQFDELWTADFSYPVDNKVAMETGIKSVEQSALFLFGTCYNLDSLEIKTNNSVIVWQQENMKVGCIR